MTTEKSNIIQFPKAGIAVPHRATTVTSDQVSSSVRRIETQSPKFHIFWDHDTRPNYQARNFFGIMMRQGHVTIQTTDGDVTLDSILNVTDGDGAEYEIPVNYFIKLTAIDPSRIDSPMEHILDYLSACNIRTGMTTSDLATTRTILTEEALGYYKPEEISGILEDETAYTCELYHEVDAPVGIGEFMMFDYKNHHITLLDFMIASYEDAEINGGDTSNVNMEVTCTEPDAMIVTTIPSDLLEKLIVLALERVNPTIYGKLDFMRARQHYFQHTIIPKINPEYEFIATDD